MALRLHRPRLLIAVLLVIVGLTSVTVLSADYYSSGYSAVPYNEPVPITAQESQRAITIVEDSGIVEDINDNQTWEVLDEEVNHFTTNDTKMASLKAIWPNTVDDDGPWKLTRCQGTRLVEVGGMVRNIKALLVTVDMDASEVVGYGVIQPNRSIPGVQDYTKPRPDSMSDTEAVKVYDTANDAKVYDGNFREFTLACPAGAEDD